MNTEQAITTLQKFLESACREPEREMDKWWTYSTTDNLTYCVIAAERVLEQFLPGWTRPTWKQGAFHQWREIREDVGRALILLESAEERPANKSELASSPELHRVSTMHHWILPKMEEFWDSGCYDIAVQTAIKTLNSKTQTKVNRRDVAETELFKQSFSLAKAQPGKARLRRMKPDDSATYRSLQIGAMSFAEGIFAGIRNPLAHENTPPLSEVLALEYLSSVSVLARWVEESEVETAASKLTASPGHEIPTQ